MAILTYMLENRKLLTHSSVVVKSKKEKTGNQSKEMPGNEGK
jgi:hypothetical protein